jgi:hypothetical protein
MPRRSIYAKTGECRHNNNDPVRVTVFVRVLLLRLPQMRGVLRVRLVFILSVMWR